MKMILITLLLYVVAVNCLRTIKCGCPVKIRAIAVKNGDGELIYKITNSNLQHLHFVPQEVRYSNAM